jgi:hypothetical protein
VIGAGDGGGSRPRFAIVVGRFYEDLAERLVASATRAFEAGGAESVDVHDVPGAFELPLAARYCADSGRYAGVAALGAVEARRDYVPRALKALEQYDGAAAAVFIRDSNPHWLSERYGQQQANHAENILRDYGIGAQILTDLGVRDMLLLTSSKTVLPGSAGYGLKILGRVPLE